MGKLIGIIAMPLGQLLFLIYQLVQNYGISLIILTAIVRIALFPLYKMQMRSTAQMAKIQPQLKQIQQKYAADRQKMSMEMQRLYQEEGVKPAAGCLPMLIQMPIIFGLFALLRTPQVYITHTEMLYAIHESFLWIPDLSQADPWILPIMAGIATFISFSMSMKFQPDDMGAGAGSMKMMKYIFPVLIVMMGRTFPGGLTIYWFFGQFLQIFFNIHLGKMRQEIAGTGKQSRKGRK